MPAEEFNRSLPDTVLPSHRHFTSVVGQVTREARAWVVGSSVASTGAARPRLAPDLRDGKHRIAAIVRRAAAEPGRPAEPRSRQGHLLFVTAKLAPRHRVGREHHRIRCQPRMGDLGTTAFSFSHMGWPVGFSQPFHGLGMSCARGGGRDGSPIVWSVFYKYVVVGFRT